MSEDPLYEVARKRIDKRNRRGILLGVNFLAFLLYVGAFAAFGFTITNRGVQNLGVFIAVAWLGVLILHSVILSMTQNRDEAIESEVAKLRDLVYENEKPKRLELSDDGELTDINDPDDLPNLDERPDKGRGDSV